MNWLKRGCSGEAETLTGMGGDEVFEPGGEKFCRMALGRLLNIGASSPNTEKSGLWRSRFAGDNNVGIGCVCWIIPAESGPKWISDTGASEIREAITSAAAISGRAEFSTAFEFVSCEEGFGADMCSSNSGGVCAAAELPKAFRSLITSPHEP